MARTLEFDYGKALDRATRLFWQYGYSETSLRDLLKAMKIGEGSFYNTLKSKKQLYLECLKHYNATVGQRRWNALLSAPTAKMGVRAFFEAVLRDLDNPKTPRACLMARSISSDVLADRDLRKYVRKEIAAVVDHFAELFASAKQKGELSSEVDPQVVAQIIGTYIQGLFPSAQLVYDRIRFERQIDVFLTGLGL